MEPFVVRKSLLYDTLLPKLELVSWALAAFGFAAKWNLVSGGNSMLTVGLLTLSTVYFLRAYEPKRREYHDDLNLLPNATEAPVVSTNSFLLDTLLPKLINISSAVVLVGTLFRLLSLAGSQQLLLVGTFTVLGAAVLLLFSQRNARRGLALAILGSIMLYIPAETWVQQFHHDDPVLVQKMIYQLQHPRDRAAAEDVRLYLQQKHARH